jgi:hypothetical protein
LKTDGLFTVHSFTIPIKHKQTIKIIPFGDVHRDSPNHAHTAWQEDLKYFRTQKNAWFLGMGDYLDSTSTSERDCLGRISADLHETLSSDINALQVEKVKLVAKELDFMKGRIIGLMGGNHYWKFPHGFLRAWRAQLQRGRRPRALQSWPRRVDANALGRSPQRPKREKRIRNQDSVCFLILSPLWPHSTPA